MSTSTSAVTPTPPITAPTNDNTTTTQPPAAASTSGISFSFTATARTTKRPLHTQPKEKPSEDATVNRQLVSGALSANSLMASHTASQDPTYGKSALVIPLIQQTNWRTAKQLEANGPDASKKRKSEVEIEALRASDQKTKRAPDGGVRFESEAELLEQAIRERENQTSTASSTNSNENAAVMMDESPPPLQACSSTITTVAAPTLEDEAIAALEESAADSASASSSHLPSIAQQASFARAAPILVANALPGNTKDMSEQDRLELDVTLRPDVPDDSAYERVPIEEFGAGMLRGMGWKGLGDVIGGINKAVVAPVQFAPRADRMGVGAEFAKPKEGRGVKKYIKPGEKREEEGLGKSTAAAPSSATPASAAELKAKTLRSLGSRLIQVHSQQLRNGAYVEVMDGPHRKMYGTISSFSDPTQAAHIDDVSVQVRLNISEEIITVRRGQIELLDERAMPDDHPAFETNEKRQKRLEKEKLEQESREQKRRTEEKDERHSSSRSKHRSHDRSHKSSSSSLRRSNSRDRHHHRDRHSHHHRSPSRSRSRSRSHDHHHHRREKSSERHSSSTSRPSNSSTSSTISISSHKPRWVRPHIRVRLLSKTLQKGALYNTKGVVQDVASARHVIVRPDGSRSTVELGEDELETVLPKPGTSLVMILAGEHRGSVGQLLQKQSETEIGVVQLSEDLNIVQVKFDDIAEYVQ